MKRPIWTRVLIALSACAVLAGGITLAVTSSQPRSFGWIAYTPRSDFIFTPGIGNFFSDPSIIGFLLVALGLIGLAFWAGFVLGSRRRF
ncbi:hypothetical protein [Paramicrobacterium agarici]|uniref:hypothetical protein n=1 Tax=Paramicrobacterium agarici TaxID=630514 RepID=UPI00116791FA|nr:hypothetical protein [Microbacterium agarici]TQO22552.1 hypothetical protein FB385_1383 [Microbacterium agarici]